MFAVTIAFRQWSWVYIMLKPSINITPWENVIWLLKEFTNTKHTMIYFGFLVHNDVSYNQ